MKNINWENDILKLLLKFKSDWIINQGRFAFPYILCLLHQNMQSYEVILDGSWFNWAEQKDELRINEV